MSGDEKGTERVDVSGDEKGTERLERGNSWTGYQVPKKLLYLSLRLIGTLSYTMGITTNPSERAFLGIGLQQLA